MRRNEEVRRIESLRCVVIGAGIMGASVAARLAAAGQHVTLLDQDKPGRATSRWSFAWINSNDKAPRHYHDLNHAGIRAWAELAPDLDGAAWHRPVGHVELAADGDELAARVGRLTDWGYPARLITPPDAAELEPALKAPGTPAAWFPEEGYLLTEPLIDRLVASAVAHGATVLTGDNGRVTALSEGRVHTATGAIIEADEIVCCAGRWTPALVAPFASPGSAPSTPLGPVLSDAALSDSALSDSASQVPLVPWDTPGSTAPGLVVRVGPVDRDGPSRVLHTPRLALRPHPGGLLHLEAGDTSAAADLHTPDPELRGLAAELLGRARRTVHGLEHATVVDYQVCVRPLPADGQSIVGRLPGAKWLYVAVTHSGVTLAAHLSRLIAADLATGTPPAELAPYRPDRFPAARPSA
jgi:glycine/D-amino acid oxidase-like deaminating enzyme